MTERAHMEQVAERLGYERHPTLDMWRHPERGTTWFGWGLVAPDIAASMARCTEDEYGDEDHHFDTEEPGDYCACGWTRQWIEIEDDTMREVLRWRPG